MAKSIYKNAVFKGILSFCNIAIPLLVIPYVYRVLDPKTIGNIEYGYSIYIYFYIFGSLGIYGYGLREISKVRNKPELVADIYRNLFAIGLISNGIAFLLIVLFAFIGFENGNLRTILLLFSIGVISNALYTEWINEAYEDFIFITLKTLIIRALSVLAIFVLINENRDYDTYVFITVLVIFLNNLVSFIYALRYTKFSFSFYDIEWRKYLPPLFFIFILNSSNVLYTTLDKTILGTYTNVETVAYYSLGNKVMGIVMALLMTGIYVSMPRLSHYLEKDYNRYILGLHKLSSRIMFIAIPSSILLIMISKEIVILLGGNQYIPAILPTQIFAFRILVLSIESIIAQQVLFLHGKEKIILSLNIVMGLINLSLKYLFIGNLSPAIAIASTTVCEILLVICELFFVKYYINLDIQLFSKSNAFYLGCALLFVPIVLIVRLLIANYLYMLLASVAVCGCFFIGAMLLLKETLVIQLYDELNNKIKSIK